MSLLKCKNLQNFKYFANPKKCRFASIVSKIYLIIIVSKFYERSVTINLEFAFVCATPCFCKRHDDKKAFCSFDEKFKAFQSLEFKHFFVKSAS